MDKSWMTKLRFTPEYEKGLDQFLDMAFDKACLSGKIICPCKRCKFGRWESRETVKEHLIVDGFFNGYTHWILHGEDSSPPKITGENKDGQLGTYGMRSTTIDVCRGKPSRAELLRQTMEWKEKYLLQREKNDILSAKIDEFAAYVHVKLGSIGQCARETSPPASSNNHHLSASTSSRIRVGSFVTLKSLGNVNEIIAIGIVNKMDNIRANGIELGPQFCEIVIKFRLKKDARLLFCHGNVETIGDALEEPVAWPLSLVALDEDMNGVI